MKKLLLLIMLILPFYLCAEEVEVMHNITADLYEFDPIQYNQLNISDVLVIEYLSGDIYWRGRLVTTDEDLVAALRDCIFEFKENVCCYKKDETRTK